MAAPFRTWSSVRLAFSNLYVRSSAGVRQCSSSSDRKELAVHEKSKSDVTEYVTPDELVSVSSLSGVPEEQLKRVARIFMPARNAMQSGTDNINHWKMEFETQERWENPLMGWASSADPLSNMSLTFDSMEEAIAYAVKSELLLALGWEYEVDQPKRIKMRPKSYAENFSWDKKTRIVSKCRAKLWTNMQNTYLMHWTTEKVMIILIFQLDALIPDKARVVNY